MKGHPAVTTGSSEAWLVGSLRPLDIVYITFLHAGQNMPDAKGMRPGPLTKVRAWPPARCDDAKYIALLLPASALFTTAQRSSIARGHPTITTASSEACLVGMSFIKLQFARPSVTTCVPSAQVCERHALWASD